MKKIFYTLFIFCAAVAAVAAVPNLSKSFDAKFHPYKFEKLVLLKNADNNYEINYRILDLESKGIKPVAAEDISYKIFDENMKEIVAGNGNVIPQYLLSSATSFYFVEVYAKIEIQKIEETVIINNPLIESGKVVQNN